MNLKTFLLSIFVLLITVSASSAVLSDYRHPAFVVANGEDINLFGNGIANGSIYDVLCTSNCTGFGAENETIMDLVADFLTAGTGINLSHDDANDTLTITNTATGGLSLFYLYNDSLMNTTLNVNGEKSTIVSYGTDNTVLKTWESPDINITSTGNGVAEVHIHLSEVSANKGSRVYARWFKNVSGTEVLLAESALSEIIDSSETEYELNKGVEIQAVNVSDTFIIRLYGNVTGSGGNAIINITTEGNTLSRFELPVPIVTGVAGAKGDTGATGASGTNGTDGINGTDGVNGSQGVAGANFTLNITGQPSIYDNATLVAGANVTLSQSGNNITIDSIGSSVGLGIAIVEYDGNNSDNRAVVHNLGRLPKMVLISQLTGGGARSRYFLDNKSLMEFHASNTILTTEGITAMDATEFYVGKSAAGYDATANNAGSNYIAIVY